MSNVTVERYAEDGRLMMRVLHDGQPVAWSFRRAETALRWADVYRQKLAAAAKIVHDDRCEQLPGGEYHGRTIGGGSTGVGFPTVAPMPIPCHCLGRADGRAQAERELRRAERKLQRST